MGVAGFSSPPTLPAPNGYSHVASIPPGSRLVWTSGQVPITRAGTVVSAGDWEAQTRLVMQQELLRIWQQANSMVIYITHDIGEALTLAQRVIVMTARPGRIKAVRKPLWEHRNVIELRRRPDFGEMETEIWQMVAEEVGQSLDKSAATGERGA